MGWLCLRVPMRRWRSMYRTLWNRFKVSPRSFCSQDFSFFLFLFSLSRTLPLLAITFLPPPLDLIARSYRSVTCAGEWGTRSGGETHANRRNWPFVFFPLSQNSVDPRWQTRFPRLDHHEPRHTRSSRTLAIRYSSWGTSNRIGISREREPVEHIPPPFLFPSRGFFAHRVEERVTCRAAEQPLKTKTDRTPEQVQKDIQDIMRQITSSVTFLPSLEDKCSSSLSLLLLLHLDLERRIDVLVILSAKTKQMYSRFWLMRRKIQKYRKNGLIVILIWLLGMLNKYLFTLPFFSLSLACQKHRLIFEMGLVRLIGTGQAEKFLNKSTQGWRVGRV